MSPAFAMENFLHNLLRVENRVHSDSTLCHICMQDCGIISTETGAVEYALRLPGCSHVFGSICITTWLQSNNSCPMCRRIFFSPILSPTLGTLTANGNDDEGSDLDLEVDEDEERHYSRDLAYHSDVISISLGLSNRTSAAALDTAYRLRRGNYGEAQEHAPYCVAALSSYVVSHLLGEAETIDNIAQVSSVHADHLFGFY